MRCRPNDLAFVVNDLEEPVNNGSIVRVVHRVDPRLFMLPVNWVCEAVTHIRIGRDMFIPGESGFAYRDLELLPFPRERLAVHETEDLELPEGVAS